MSLRNGGWSSIITPLKCTLEQDHKYTGIAIGNIKTSPHARVIVLDDDPSSDIPTGETELHVVDAYPHWVKLDVTINNIVVFTGLEFDKRSKAVYLPAKEYICKAMVSGNYDDPAAGPQQLDLKTGKSYLLVVLDQKADGHQGIVVLPDN